MRYWVYINDKVDGPFDVDSLKDVAGFTPDTLICAENTADGANQEWVKASTVLNLEETVVTESQEMPFDESISSADVAPIAATAAVDVGIAGGNDLVNLLLSKLDSITSQMSGLQSKLDGMENKFDKSIATVNETLAKQQETLSKAQQNIPAESQETSTLAETTDSLEPLQDVAAVAAIEATSNMPSMDVQTVNEVQETTEVSESATTPFTEPVDETPALSISDTNESQNVDLLETLTLDGASSLDGEGKIEEEVIVTSALDSLYNAKIQQEDNESTFQDLLSPKEAAGLATQLDAVNQKNNSLDQLLNDTPDATPLEGEARENLISEITAAPAQESALDQLLNENNAETQSANIADKQEDNGFSAKDAILPALAAVGTGVAVASAMNNEQKEEPAKEYEVPSLDSMDTPVVAEQKEEKKDEFEELVANSSVEKGEEDLLSKEDLAGAFSNRDTSASQEASALEGAAATVDEKEAVVEENVPQIMPSLEEEEKGTQPTEAVVEQPQNANEMTEIEIKEGGTYFISDFVPSATAGNELPKELDTLIGGKPAEEGEDNKTQTIEIQDLVSSTSQDTQEQTLPENAPEKTSISSVILENTIRAKKGANLDIKTVPMVAEPANTERLHLDGFDDNMNAQHDVQVAEEMPTAKNTTKMVLAGLGGFLLLCVLYVGLAFMNILPASLNLFGGNKQEQANNANVEEMLPTNEPTVTSDVLNAADTALPQDNVIDPKQQVLEDVQNYPLANGYTLKEFIEQKHPMADGLITWDISSAVEPDNFSVLVKVPPENPQSFKTSYRFNYNAVTRELVPTISDAKNLLDSVNQ